MMHEIEITEEVLLQVMTRSGSRLELSGLGVCKTGSQEFEKLRSQSLGRIPVLPEN